MLSKKKEKLCRLLNSKSFPVFQKDIYDDGKIFKGQKMFCPLINRDCKTSCRSWVEARVEGRKNLVNSKMTYTVIDGYCEERKK